MTAPHSSVKLDGRLANFLTVIGALRPEQMSPLFVTYVAMPLFLFTAAAVFLLRRIDATFVMAIRLGTFAFAALLGTGITSDGDLRTSKRSRFCNRSVTASHSSRSSSSPLPISTQPGRLPLRLTSRFCDSAGPSLGCLY
jgi:hypothetical protein